MEKKEVLVCDCRPGRMDFVAEMRKCGCQEHNERASQVDGFFRVTKEAPSERPLPCGRGDDRGSWRRKMQRCNACGVGIAMELGDGDGDGDMMEIS